MTTKNNNLQLDGILAQFSNKPVLMASERLNAFLHLVRDRQHIVAEIQAKHAEEDSGDGGFDYEKEYADWLPDSRAKYGVVNSVATVPICGVVCRSTSKIERLFFGLCDVDLVARDVQTALADPAVKVIKLYINSPGGSASQVAEVAQIIADAAEQKPVIAVVDELCASAAMWLAAGANLIIATASADIGSIGVYLAFMDLSGWFNEMGVKVEIIKAGKLKATGAMGTSLTEEQRAYLQAGVDELYQMFTSFVSEQRDGVTPEAMQGQTFLAAKAKEMNLIDEVFPNIGAVESEIADIVSQIP